MLVWRWAERISALVIIFSLSFLFYLDCADVRIGWIWAGRIAVFFFRTGFGKFCLNKDV